jgi:thiol-disulfide isomerase/thioredoxin
VDAVFVIAFVAAGCPPCDSFKDDLRSGRIESDVRIVVVDAKEKPGLAQKCGVTVTPTFVAIQDERQVFRKSGYTSPDSLNDWLGGVKPVALR